MQARVRFSPLNDANATFNFSLFAAHSGTSRTPHSSSARCASAVGRALRVLGRDAVLLRAFKATTGYGNRGTTQWVQMWAATVDCEVDRNDDAEHDERSAGTHVRRRAFRSRRRIQRARPVHRETHGGRDRSNPTNKRRRAESAPFAPRDFEYDHESGNNMGSHWDWG
jgi:hypothetical protein